MLKQALLSCAMALTASLSVPAFAQEYPAAPIHIVIPYAPGGGSDILARPVGIYIEASLKQPVVIDNKGGAGGNIGAEFVARSTPNGYTLLLANNSHVINQFVYKKPGYSLEKDFVPVSLVGTSPTIVVVHKSVPVTSIRELIDYAQKNAGKLNFSSAGVGTPGHLAGLLFNKQANTNIVHVAYKKKSISTSQRRPRQTRTSSPATLKRSPSRHAKDSLCFPMCQPLPNRACPGCATIRSMCGGACSRRLEPARRSSRN
jgi:tripartite-type tricarboxylate transporter receptor subunit TctC